MHVPGAARILADRLAPRPHIPADRFDLATITVDGQDRALIVPEIVFDVALPPLRLG